ncbi:hypothetical protein C1645_825942 [Glomus cerebriforme]|uniref:Uncharacterized protein n=1 Tax=Glomus cerebriforme TaxID=658196 RepID=A0A397SRG0_9GLOM|nr:hypothetical protein C1645_825942 [Glomus cerebriforme]
MQNSTSAKNVTRLADLSTYALETASTTEISEETQEISENNQELPQSTLGKRKTLALGDTIVRWFPGDWTLGMRKERFHYQAVIHNIADDLTEKDLFLDENNTRLNQAKSYKIVKDTKGNRKIIGFFEKQADVIKACQASITFKNVEYKWVRDNYKQEKHKAGSKYKRNTDLKKDLDKKKKSKSTSSSNKKDKKSNKNKRGGSQQDSVVDILVKALTKITAGQEKSKSRKEKKNKARGSSRS